MIIMDAVDYMRLQRVWCWTNRLLDFRIQFLANRLFPLDCGAPVFSLASTFYHKLTSAEGDLLAGYERVAHCTGTVDIFSLEFLLVPVVLEHHWSLLVVARPGAARCGTSPATSGANSTGLSSARGGQERLDRPVIMHMDPSRGMHCTAKLGSVINR